MKLTIASLSVLATVLACGATVLTHARDTHQLEKRVAPQDPARGLGARSSHLLETAADDTSLRVTPVVQAVRRSADSVVSIYVVDPRRGSRAALQADGQGSGVILDAGGLVITNWHVVAKAAAPGTLFNVVVRLKNNRQYDAKVLSTSPDDDLALLSLTVAGGDELQPIVLGDSASLMVGETVVAIGNPQGHANTVTVGVLSAEDRSIRVRTPDGNLRNYTGLLQTDAAINGGNSGGALLDITGKLVGINNAMAVGVENIGFAIPVNTVKRVFQNVLISAENLVTSVWVGMQVAERDGAVQVTEVSPGGPADREGIRSGDEVVRVSGNRVESVLEYTRQVLRAQPGESFRLDLRRSGRAVRAAPVPLSSAGWEILKRVGIEVETITPERDRELVVAASLAFHHGRGRPRMMGGVVRIKRVAGGGTAERLGLEVGDVMLGCSYSDGWYERELPFVSESDLADKLRPFIGGQINVSILRHAKQLEGPLQVLR